MQNTDIEIDIEREEHKDGKRVKRINEWKEWRIMSLIINKQFTILIYIYIHLWYFNINIQNSVQHKKKPISQQQLMQSSIMKKKPNKTKNITIQRSGSYSVKFKVK